MDFNSGSTYSLWGRSPTIWQCIVPKFLPEISPDNFPDVLQPVHLVIPPEDFPGLGILVGVSSEDFSGVRQKNLQEISPGIHAGVISRIFCKSSSKNSSEIF